ncbi:type II toxin-antitoxin system HipA family toxin YjjJ [Lysobacter silvisoli]|uniref:Type II toxin-antitoxin system HipA family toxinoxin YjjJ n=1 Tax=Lysobacter silvisoli TaxID=2293254 RepID=A0A371JYA9_9GAMM|nr:type II toxin-antitoxin system HipA family toxin YjjJ [Lysobacter silvisoli]RDZ26661.1 type II toxin-antitoxin system HipA family toxinoxin YjjJ [Lysobacter silvisoli]
MSRHSQAVEALLRWGPHTAAALAAQLGISQPTVSRALADLGPALVRIGHARASRYALARDVGRAGNRWPLYRIGLKGRPDTLGELQALYGGWLLRSPRALPLYPHGEFDEGQYTDLPWFLYDLRPQGFLGRAFARRHAAELGVPENPEDWTADDVLIALLRRGDDLPGDLVLGEAALEQALLDTVLDNLDTLIAPQQRTAVYPQRALAAEAGEIAGSSAGGEQPKFTAELDADNGERISVIVKFARHDPDNATARRWVNLLVCEHLAGQVLTEHGIAAASSELIDSEGWRFLQSMRFDRTPQRGRRGTTTLRALDAAYTGSDPHQWPAAAAALQREGIVSAADAERIRRLHLFGRFIGNTDMHFGNLSFHTEPQRLQVALAPVYDMLPMHYRPGAGGAVHQRPYELPLPTGDLAAWQWAGSAALDLWRRAQDDTRIGPAFRAVAASNALRIEQALQRFGN